MTGTEIAAVAAPVVQGLSSGLFANAQNKRIMRFQREQYDRQRQDSLSDWHMQNAYNDPAAQMQRLRDAGLNPNLMYGQGTVGNAETPRQSTAHGNAGTALPDLSGIGQVALNAMQMKQLQSNIARTDAETANIEARTFDQNFDNSVKEALGISHYTNVQQIDMKTKEIDQDLRSLGYSKQLADYNAWSLAGFEGKPTTEPNSPLAKMYKAGIGQAMQELDNAKKLGDIRAAETAIKQFEVRLTKMGISPNSPWFVKGGMDLYRRIKDNPMVKQWSDETNRTFLNP